MKHSRVSGFTLVEMIMVMVITGILAAMVAVFLVSPVKGYFSSVRRAVLTEEADGALRFIARDLKSALPNSITCTGGGLQYLAIRSGGRFREGQTNANSGTPLVFGTASTSFDIIGSNAESTTRDAYGNNVSGTSSRVVVGNLGSGVPSCHSDYSVFASNAATLSSMTGTSVTIGSNAYPVACNLASATAQDNAGTASVNESNDREFGRFYVVDSSPVTYVCNTSSGLTRNGSTMVPASHVNACAMVCDSTKARVQLVTVSMTLKDTENELVNMLRRVTIVNRP